MIVLITHVRMADDGISCNVNINGEVQENVLLHPGSDFQFATEADYSLEKPTKVERRCKLCHKLEAEAEPGKCYKSQDMDHIWEDPPPKVGARCIYSSPDNVEEYLIYTHKIQFGGDGDGFCYLHQSFSCLENLSPEERAALNDPEDFS